MNADELAHRILSVMSESPVGTVLTLDGDGRISARLPGFGDVAGNDRRRPFIATFVVSRNRPLHAEVVQRLATGLRKRAFNA